MNVLIVRFRLAGIDPVSYEKLTTQVAPAISQFPGLISKAWLADAERDVYGGVYLFAERESVDAYLASEIGRSLQNSGLFEDVTIEIFDTIVAATEMTLPQAYAAV
jgi:hypothetical protein